MLDLGPLAIKVPEVEDEATVHEAIDAFYFPPIGRRSWGGQVGYGIDARPDRLAYAQWWNQEGVLGFKIESLAAVLNIRALVKPGITFVDFGGQDLRFSMETTPHPTLTSVEECKEFVRQQLTGVPVRIL